ncbi:MAG: chemotaxis protein CheW [Pseudomonadota bacterium]
MDGNAGGKAPMSNYVVAELGALRLGVPVGVVVGAVERGATPAPLGRRRGAVCEVVTHLGRPVPVLDLALWVDVGACAAGRAARSLILLLRDGARMLGVLVDAVDGVAAVAADALVRIHHDESEEEIFHSVAQGGAGERPLSLLDVARLMALAAVWADDAAAAAPQADGQGEGAGAPAQDWAVFESAGVRMAVPAVAVGELLVMPVLDRLLGSGARGICHWRGRHVAVLDAGALFGAGAARTPRPLLLTICGAGLALGLAVDRVVHLRRIGQDPDRHALHPDAPPFVQSVAIDADGVPVNLIDCARLMAMFPEASISEVDAASDSGPRGAGRSNGVAYIVYRAGAMVASPIDGLEEVLQADGEATGTIEWRGKAIALVDLRGPEKTTGHILVLRHAGRLAGVLVDSIESLVTPHTGHLSKVSLPGARFDMLTTGRGPEQASYRILDLGQEVAARLAPAAELA